MKFAILILAFLCGASAQGVSDHLRTFFEQERQNFPCGWPNYPWNEPQGIAPLEPYRTTRPWNFHFETLGSIYDKHSVITNQVIRGLQSFVLDHVQLEVIGMWMRMNFVIPILNVEGTHDTRGNLFQNGQFVPFSGRGPYIAQVRNFRIDTTSALNFIQPGNFLNVRAMNTQVTLGSLVLHMEGFGAQGTTINSIVNGNLPAYIANPDTQARFNQAITEAMMPVLNAQFNLVTMPEFISFLSGRVTNPPLQRCFVRNGIKIEI